MAVKFIYNASWFSNPGSTIACHNGLTVTVLGKAQPPGAPMGSQVPSQIKFSMQGWNSSLVVGKSCSFSFAYKLQALYDGQVWLSNNVNNGAHVGKHTYVESDAAIDKYAKFNELWPSSIDDVNEVMGSRLAMHVWMNSVNKPQFNSLLVTNSGFDIENMENKDFSGEDAKKLLTMFIAFGNPLSPQAPVGDVGFVFPWLNPSSGPGHYKLTEVEFFKQFSVSIEDASTAVQPKTFLNKWPSNWDNTSPSPTGWQNWPTTKFGEESYEFPCDLSRAEFWQGFYFIPLQTSPPVHNPPKWYHTGWFNDCNPAQYLAVLLRSLTQLPDAVWQTWSQWVTMKSPNLVDSPHDFLTRTIASMRRSKYVDWNYTPPFVYTGFGNSDIDYLQVVDVQDFVWSPDGWSGPWAQFARGLAQSSGLLAMCSPCVSAYRPDMTSGDGLYNVSFLGALGSSPGGGSIVLPWNASAPTNLNQQTTTIALYQVPVHSTLKLQNITDEFVKLENLKLVNNIPQEAPWGTPVTHCVVVAGRSRCVYTELDKIGNGTSGSWGLPNGSSVNDVFSMLKRWLNWNEFFGAQVITYAFHRALLQTYQAAANFILISPQNFVPSLPGMFATPLLSPAGFDIYSLPSKLYSGRYGAILLTFAASVVNTPLDIASESSVNGWPTALRHAREFTAVMLTVRKWSQYTCAALAGFSPQDQALVAQFGQVAAMPGPTLTFWNWLVVQPGGMNALQSVVRLNSCVRQFFKLALGLNYLDPVYEMPTADIMPRDANLYWFGFAQGGPQFFNLVGIPLPFGNASQQVVPTLSSFSDVMVLVLSVALRAKHYWKEEVVDGLSPNESYEDASLGPP